MSICSFSCYQDLFMHLAWYRGHCCAAQVAAQLVLQLSSLNGDLFARCEQAALVCTSPIPDEGSLLHATPACTPMDGGAASRSPSSSLSPGVLDRLEDACNLNVQATSEERGLSPETRLLLATLPGALGVVELASLS